MKIETIIQRAWYKNHAWIKALAPLSKLYKYESERRKKNAIENRRPAFFTPVIVVGNITAGGTGKTPLIIHLVSRLQTRGLRVGVISRGYGATPPETPYLVERGGNPEYCGDEPLLIADSTGVPVVIDPDRCAAAEKLLELGVDIVLSDDGLQHYALPRSYEIAVVDATRGLGNGLLLPAGPLRELPERLSSVDFVVCNGNAKDLDSSIPVNASFELRPSAWVNVKTGTRIPMDLLSTDGEIDVLAGIGNPERFFNTLRYMGISFREHIFPDHHQYQEADFQFLSDPQKELLVMTTKDALKCRDFAGPNWWALDVDVDFGNVAVENRAFSRSARVQPGDKLLIDALVALRDP